MKVDHYLGLPSYDKPMTIIIWNCRGAQHHNFTPTVREIVNLYNPNILVIAETRIRATEVSCIIDKLSFDA